MGFGLLGEQGIESVHAHFNSLGRTYRSIPEEVDRLRQLMKEHLLHIAPEHVSATPEGRAEEPDPPLQQKTKLTYTHHSVNVIFTIFNMLPTRLKKSRSWYA